MIFQDTIFTDQALLVLCLPYPLAVQIVHCFGDSVEHSARFSLWEELLPKNLIQQLSSLH